MYFLSSQFPEVMPCCRNVSTHKIIILEINLHTKRRQIQKTKAI